MYSFAPCFCFHENLHGRKSLSVFQDIAQIESLKALPVASNLIAISHYTSHLGAPQLNPSDSKGHRGTLSIEWEDCESGFVTGLAFTDNKEVGEQRPEDFRSQRVNFS